MHQYMEIKQNSSEQAMNQRCQREKVLREKNVQQYNTYVKKQKRSHITLGYKELEKEQTAQSYQKEEYSKNQSRSK